MSDSPTPRLELPSSKDIQQALDRLFGFCGFSWEETTSIDDWKTLAFIDDAREMLEEKSDALTAARAQVAALTERQWRDMASAPKDGAKFIGKYGSMVFTTHWQAFNDFGPQKPGGGCDVIGQHFGWSHEESDRMGYLTPTAWMPLPPAPVSDQPQGE